jgi:4-diphosphocytidyl-2-C-methyl-D-erythritol kinase
MKLKAYSKINLGLEIINKRQDGYHELNTCFLRTCLADVISFEINSNIIVTTEPDINIAQDENLVYKAAVELKKHFPDTTGCKIHIEKNIPSGAGLGGGSTDAATALYALVKLWGIKPDNDTLFDIAKSLGSDVPFFLNEKAAIAQGRGEILSYFDFNNPWWTVLIKPDVSISTSWAYKNLDISSIQRTPSDLRKTILKSLSETEILKNNIINHFEDLVFHYYPEIKEIKEKLYSSGAILSLLSGSGSTVFGLFEQEKNCLSAVKQFKNCFTFICPPQKLK